MFAPARSIYIRACTYSSAEHPPTNSCTLVIFTHSNSTSLRQIRMQTSTKTAVTTAILSQVFVTCLSSCAADYYTSEQFASFYKVNINLQVHVFYNMWILAKLIFVELRNLTSTDAQTLHGTYLLHCINLFKAAWEKC